MKETWRDVKGYEGDYQISDLGRVKSLKFGREKILKQSLTKIGYFKVNLHKNKTRNTCVVHVLVAVAFLNHKPDGHKIVIDHIDNDKLNNCIDNLQLITQRENISKDIVRASSRYIGVHWQKRAKKWRSQIQIKGKIKHLGYFKCEIEASKVYQDALKELETN